jgi:uncharacterized protein (TIGR03083 family)
LNAELDRLRRGYERLFTLSEHYPLPRRDRAGACGEWSPREVLAHLTGWLLEARRRFESYDRGDAQKIVYDFDDFNAKSVAARQAMTWEEIIEEQRTALDALIAHVESIPPERLAQNPRYGQWLEALARDCETHTAQLVGFQHH